MPKNKRLEFPDFDKMGKDLEDLIVALPDLAGVAAVNFFQDRFKQKGWIDQGGLEPWSDRKEKGGNGSVLMVTGKLKDSYDYNTGKDWVEVTNFAPYSKLHNEGGIATIKITKKSRGFFWYMYKKTSQPHWKFMALSKKNFFTIHIPKRQHIGHSTFFMKRVDMAYRKQLDSFAKNHLK